MPCRTDRHNSLALLPLSHNTNNSNRILMDYQEQLKRMGKYEEPKPIEKEEPTKEIDWEQRRYEIAKDMLSVMYIDEGQESRKGNHKDMNSCASEAVRWADALIEELKKTSK